MIASVHERGSRRFWLSRLPLAAVLLLASGCGGSALEVRDGQPEKSPIDSTVIVDCGGYAQVAPVEMAVACRAGGPMLTTLKWRDWGQERAAAVGRFTCTRCEQAQTRAVRVEVAGRVLRRDATLAYRTVTVTPEAAGTADRPRPLRYQLYDGYLEATDGHTASQSPEEAP